MNVSLSPSLLPFIAINLKINFFPLHNYRMLSPRNAAHSLCSTSVLAPSPHIIAPTDSYNHEIGEKIAAIVIQYTL